MAFITAGALTVFSAVLYLASERIAFVSACRYTIDMCQHPFWPFYAALGFVALGALLQVQKS